MTQDKIDILIEKYRAAGHIAFRYPRLKRIALNGGRRTTYDIACKSMRECLARNAR